MTMTQLVAGFLYAAIDASIPDFIKPDEDGARTQAFYARCQMAYLFLTTADE